MCCVGPCPAKCCTLVGTGEWLPRLDNEAVRGCVSRRNPGASSAVFRNAPARRPGWRSADTGSGTLLFSQSCSDVIGLPLALALSELLRAASEGDGASGEPPDDEALISNVARHLPGQWYSLPTTGIPIVLPTQ